VQGEVCSDRRLRIHHTLQESAHQSGIFLNIFF